MPDENDKHPLNAPGEFYNDFSCIDCGLCPELAPSVFKRDDEEGYSYVYKQPTTPEEFLVTQEALEGCPTESIHRNLSMQSAPIT